MFLVFVYSTLRKNSLRFSRIKCATKALFENCCFTDVIQYIPPPPTFLQKKNIVVAVAQNFVVFVDNGAEVTIE